MAGRGAGVRNLVLVRHFRRNEVKCVATDIDVSDGLFDFRHVTGHAIATGAAGLVMCVSFY